LNIRFALLSYRSSILFMVLLFLSFQKSKSQDVFFKWAKESRGSTAGDTEGKAIISDPNGNVYTTNSIGNNEYGESFLLKSDSCGNIIWQCKFMPETRGGPKTTSLTVDLTGNIYITGYFLGMVDFDPGIGVWFLSTGLKTPAMFICKLSVNGNLIWARQFGNSVAPGLDSTDSGASGYSITPDGSGYIYTTGNFTGQVDFDPGPGSNMLTPGGNPSNNNGFILKLDTNGNFVFAKQLTGESASNAYSIHTDQDGSIYLAGEFNGVTDFDPADSRVYTLSSEGESDAFILKLDANGNFTWCKQFGSGSSELCNSVMTDQAGNVYFKILFGLRMDLTLDVDPGPGEYNLRSETGNRVICKLNSSGDFQWAFQDSATNKSFVYPEYNRSLDRDRIGNICYIGTFSESLNISPGYPAAGKSDIFILKLDHAGNKIWVKVFGGNNSDGSSTISIDDFDNIYSTGYFNGIADMDPGPGIYPLNSKNTNFNFIQKLSPNTSISSIQVTACGSFTFQDSTYNKTGNYILRIRSVSGCDSLVYLNLTIGIPVETIDTSICVGQSLFVAGSYQTKSGTYTDTLKTQSGCDSLIITNLLVQAQPKPNLGSDRDICAGNSLILSPGIFRNYLWQDHSQNGQFTATIPGNYWVTVTDSNNCQSSDTISIPGIQALPNDFLPSSETVCRGGSTKISIPGYHKYLWSNGDTTSSTSLISTGIYFLTVTDLNLCTGKDSIQILHAENCIPISIPNAFTPNQDGLNDIFKPYIRQDVIEYSFRIYNRFGQRVFETTYTATGWDGNMGGRNQEPGTYVYQIYVKNRLGDIIRKHGSVVLIR